MKTLIHERAYVEIDEEYSQEKISEIFLLSSQNATKLCEAFHLFVDYESSGDFSNIILNIKDCEA